MKKVPVIKLAIAFGMGLFACTNHAAEEDDIEQNDPALDTINIHHDTLNNFPVPLPDSTLMGSDTIALFHPVKIQALPSLQPV